MQIFTSKCRLGGNIYEGQNKVHDLAQKYSNIQQKYNIMNILSIGNFGHLELYLNQHKFCPL